MWTWSRCSRSCRSPARSASLVRAVRSGAARTTARPLDVGGSSIVVEVGQVVGVTWVVDVFAGRWSGLVLAEVEVDHLSAPLALPPWAGPEVTAVDALFGGALATTPDADVADVLAQVQAGWPVQV